MIICDYIVISPKRREAKIMSKVMTIRPPEELREKLKKYCLKRGYTVNQLVLQILWEWIKTKEVR